MSADDDDDEDPTRVNTTHFITILYDFGRLGNRMLQYAVLVRFARRTRRQPIVDCDGLLTSKFSRIAAECTPQAAERFATLAPSKKHAQVRGNKQLGQVLKAREKYTTPPC